MSTAPGVALADRVARRQRSPLERYRDDGPLARALGAAAGPLVKLPPLLPAMLGTAGVLLLAAVQGDSASNATVAAGVAWLVIWAAISAGRPHADRFAWAVPATLRLGEYGALIWIGATAGGSSSAAAFALIAALAFRHYDLVYRSRFQGIPPAEWLQVASGGWDGRLIVVTILFAAGTLPAALFAMAGLLGSVFVAECVTSWARHGTSPVSVYEDEEDEGD